VTTTDASSLAPGVPADYYAQIRAVEDSHWWYRSMRELSVALLGPGLAGADAVLDAGCGSGGFLHWLVDRGSFRSVAGIDVAGAAVELARKRVPGADLRVAPLAAIPFDDASFDLVICNDVLQHVDESELARSLSELRRVLRPEGRLLLRTNGSRKLRRERSDWRAYDRVTLRSQLEAAGFVVERVTHANLVPSLWGVATRRVPHAPTEDAHGIPSLQDSAVKSLVASSLLRVEGRILRSTPVNLPYGHALFALARR